MGKESLATTGRKKPYVSIRYSTDALITVLWILLVAQTRKQDGSGSVINRRIDFRWGKTMAEQSLFRQRAESNANCTALRDAELFHQRTRNYILARIIVTEAVLSRSSRLLEWPMNRETDTSDWFFPVLEEIGNFDVSRRISTNPESPYSRTVRWTKNEFVGNLGKSRKKAAKSGRRDAKKNGKRKSAIPWSLWRVVIAEGETRLSRLAEHRSFSRSHTEETQKEIVASRTNRSR